VSPEPDDSDGNSKIRRHVQAATAKGFLVTDLVSNFKETDYLRAGLEQALEGDEQPFVDIDDGVAEPCPVLKAREYEQTMLRDKKKVHTATATTTTTTTANFILTYLLQSPPPPHRPHNPPSFLTPTSPSSSAYKSGRMTSSAESIACHLRTTSRRR
jgi:hypothetical protein